MASVTFDRTTRHYPGTPTPAVDAIDLVVDDGEFLVLVGPSGCGKTTSLRMLAGLEPVDDGRVLIGDRNVTSVAPKNRDIAMVFQNYALYPQMTVAQNMGFALRNAGVNKAEIATKVAEAARMLDLGAYLERKPAQLSGGQRQRVAMGRALVRSPQVFLMDEPLSNLDALLRVQTRTEITALQRRLGVTTVYVTHDQTEAMTMADRVVVLDGGRIQQVGTPSDLFDRPANLFVASFIGSPPMNLADARIDNGVAMVGGVAIALSDDVRAIAAGEGIVDVRVGFRPEDAVLVEPADGLPVRIDAVEVLGADALIYATTLDGAVAVIVRADGRQPPRIGDAVGVRIGSDHIHVFDRATGNRVGTV